jgi:hypothetical protein
MAHNIDLVNLKKMKNILIFISICLLGNACCTKKDCDQENTPEIVIKLDGFNSSDLTKVSIILLDLNSIEKIDSISFFTESNIYKISKWILEDKKIEIKDYSYIIKTNVSADTINHINYEKYSKTIKCNSCFPFGDGSATVINYRGFSFQHVHTKYNDNDTLVIKK